ncbi:unnamed protein product [Dibothriocephalus latus]|uniref:Uncharacterized protein n=1 Tax=Dibothriocephalus latus TaxID=60516 RepID=A0A3P7L0N5_DIBLA|nr:unnamed protein product [Dibothriocephalus latus]
MTSSPAASQAILSTESPDSTEHTFTFVLPDFYDNEHMNESDADHHFNNSDWTGFGAGVETEGSNEMFDDACAYLQHRVEYLFKINLTECVTSWEESSDNEPSAMCDLLKRTIVDVCKRVDGCDEDDLMKTVFEHLKNLLTTESLHDAIVMVSCWCDMLESSNLPQSR